MKAITKLTNVDEILAEMKRMGSKENREGMGRYGINVTNALGIKITDLRKFARRVEKSHDLADELWRSGIHEARIMATLVEVPELVTEEQADKWAADFDSWDMVDLCCNNILRKTGFAHDLAVRWSEKDEEFIKRAGFSMMAVLAVHDKVAGDSVFRKYLKIIERSAGDDRNFVRKSVNWALRGIGKRNARLWKAAVSSAERIKEQGTKSARWIANDALRELKGKGPV